MAILKNDFVDGDAIVPGSIGGTNGLNATNDRINTHTHEGTDTPALSQHPTILASSSGTTTITGNGSAQNVFTDSWTALTEGQKFVVEVHLQTTNTAGADTPDVVLAFNGTTLDTVTMSPGASPNYVFWRATGAYSATADIGFVFVEAKEQAAAMASPLDQNSLTTAPSSLTLTCDSAAATTTRCRYSYVVTRYQTGI